MADRQAESAADGRCGGGSFATQVVKAAGGVSVMVPADWKVQSAKAAAVIRFSPPDPDSGDGYLAVQPSTQTLDRPGLDAARLTTFRYDADQGGAFSVDLAAVGGGVRVLGSMSRDRDADEQAAAESCLSSVTLTP